MAPKILVFAMTASLSTNSPALLEEWGTNARFLRRVAPDNWWLPRDAVEIGGHQLKQASNPVLNDYIRRVGYAAEDDLYDGGQGTVSQQAQSSFYSLALGLEQFATSPLRAPNVSLFMGTGIIAEWRTTHKHVVLMVAPSGEARIHQITIPHDDNEITQTVEHPATAQGLKAALEWLESNG